MIEYRHFNFVRFRNIRNPSEPPPNTRQRIMATALWLGTLPLAISMFINRPHRLDWPQLGILIATHITAGLLSIRLPRGYFVGFVLTNLLAIGLVFGINGMLEVALISSGILSPIMIVLAGLARIRGTPPFFQIYEIMYTSVSNALAAAGAIWVFDQIGGSVSLIEVPQL